MHHIKDS